jgi:hypothetical protein
MIRQPSVHRPRPLGAYRPGRPFPPTFGESHAGSQALDRERGTHWVSLTVDPRDPQLFELRPQIVPGNVDDR